MLFTSAITTCRIVIPLDLSQEVLILWETLLFVWSPVFLSTFWTNNAEHFPSYLLDKTHKRCGYREYSWDVGTSLLKFLKADLTGKHVSHIVSVPFNCHDVEYLLYEKPMLKKRCSYFLNQLKPKF